MPVFSLTEANPLAFYSILACMCINARWPSQRFVSTQNKNKKKLLFDDRDVFIKSQFKTESRTYKKQLILLSTIYWTDGVLLPKGTANRSAAWMFTGYMEVVKAVWHLQS